MPSPAFQVQPPSPAVEAACAAIARSMEARAAGKAQRQSRIDGDRRIIARRAAHAALQREYLDGMDGAFLLFADMAAGRIAQQSVIKSLTRARIALLDNDRAAARQNIRAATFARRQHWSVTEATPDFIRMVPNPPALVVAELAVA